MLSSIQCQRYIYNWNNIQTLTSKPTINAIYSDRLGNLSISLTVNYKYTAAFLCSPSWQQTWEKYKTETNKCDHE